MYRSVPLATALLLASTSARAEEDVNSSLLIQPQFGTIFWTTLTFILLLVLLGKYAWKPLLAAVEARENGIRDAIDEAKRGREEAQRLVEEHRAMVNLARKERAEAVEAGRRDAERLKGEILDEARKQREQLLKQAEAQIQSGIRQARVELSGATADLAIRAAERLMKKNLDDPTHRKLVEDYLAELERLGAGSDAQPS